MAKKKLVLYPKVTVKGKSFKGVKKVVVPDQSMSLLEIIRRFTRKESLPVQHDGVYEDRFGDLEKLSREDITVQEEKIEEIKEAVNKFKAREKKKKEEEEKERAKGAQAPPPSPPPPAPPPEKV